MKPVHSAGARYPFAANLADKLLGATSKAEAERSVYARGMLGADECCINASCEECLPAKACLYDVAAKARCPSAVNLANKLLGAASIAEAKGWLMFV